MTEEKPRTTKKEVEKKGEKKTEQEIETAGSARKGRISRRTKKKFSSAPVSHQKDEKKRKKSKQKGETSEKRQRVRKRQRERENRIC